MSNSNRQSLFAPLLSRTRVTLPGLSLFTSVFFAYLLLAGCQKPTPLPEQGTFAQRLYVERCGVCHRPFNPASMTAAMWEVQVEAMQVKIAQGGQPPLSPEQHLAILDYLKRNAGKQ
jgi:Dihaem cytochrome c